MLEIYFDGKVFTSYEDADEQLELVRTRNDGARYHIDVYRDEAEIDSVSLIIKNDNIGFKEMIDSIKKDTEIGDKLEPRRYLTSEQFTEILNNR